ncbi:MAG: xanthine dehydrogenase family protein subunit M [Deltaproteobacteria bacterium]|nr:xanthine dehydrogenase family protein subunit M [Deltaproteobacteria bacterium]
MKPSAFEYFTPATVTEAIGLLERYGEEAKVLAGGQSLIPMMNFRVARPKVLVDINQVKDLDYIREEKDELVIGGLTRERAVEVSPLVQKKCPILSEAISYIGHLPIRTRGTMGGSLVHADPTAEIPVVVSALEGKMKVAGPSGERLLGADEFFVTYLTSALDPLEILVEVRIPTLPPNTGWSFMEFNRRYGDFGIVSVAALLFMGDKERCQKASLALGGVGPTPLRTRKAEKLLAGQVITDALIAKAGIQASQETEPESDYHASAEYRRNLARVFTQRSLTEAWNKVKGGK